MVRKLLYAAVLLGAGANVYAQNFTDGAEYILQDVSTSRYFGGANAWGTQASLIEHGHQVKLNYVSDGVYTIDSHAYNNESSHFFGGTYIDSGATNIYFTAVGDNYVLSTEENGSYITYLDANAVNPTLTNTGASVEDAIKWKVTSVEDLTAALTENSDATFLIKNWNFSRNQNSSYYPTWTGAYAGGGANENCCAERYHNVFDVYQTVTVPNGTYKVVGQGFYRQDGTDAENLPVFYANAVSTVLPTIESDAEKLTQNYYGGSTYTGSNPNNMTAASGAFSENYYRTEPVEVTVTTGELKIGYKLEGNTNLWTIFDKVELTYLRGVDLSEYVTSYNEAVDAANAVDQTAVMSPDALSELQKAIADYSGKTYSTSDEYGTATSALATATNNALASIAVYANAASVINRTNSLLEANNFYTAEAYETFNAALETLVNSYNSGTLTNDEASAFQTSVFGNGWHSANTVDDLLLSTWGTTDYNGSPYINTWSVEADNHEHGSGMTVPFFEYWTGDANSLGATSINGSLSGVENGNYEVSVLVRVRVKNDVTDNASGITFSVNGGEAVNVCEGASCDDGTQFFYGTFTAAGEVTDGTLNISFDVAEDNNISWLSYKDIKYTKVEAQVDEELENAKTAAIAALDNLSPIGDGLFYYSQENIDAAKAAVNAATTVEDVNAAAAVSVNAPVEGTSYIVVNNTADGNLNVGESSVTIAKYAKVYFTAVEGGFAISNEEGNYIFKTTNNTWTLSTTTSIDEAYVLTVNPVENGYTIEGVKGILGTDNTSEGSTVYANKTASNNGVWTIEKYDLDAVKNAALTALDALSVGDGLFYYSQESIDAVKAAINNATTIEEVMAVEQPSANAPVDGQAYLVANTTADGNLSVSESGVTVVKDAKVYFTAVDGGYVISNENGDYIYKTTDNNWTLSTTKSVDEAYVVNFSIADGTYTIQGAKGTFGTDNTEENSAVYADKSAEKNGCWTISAYVPEVVPDADHFVLRYTGKSTTNMTGENEAALLNLDSEVWSVVGVKGDSNNFPGLNKDGSLRLYHAATGDVDNSIIVSNNAYIVDSIRICYTDADHDGANVFVNDESAEQLSYNSYKIDNTSFVVSNGRETNSQVRIDSILVFYSEIPVAIGKVNTVANTANVTKKVVKNGKIYIIKDDKTYNLNGTEVE